MIFSFCEDTYAKEVAIYCSMMGLSMIMPIEKLASGGTAPPVTNNYYITESGDFYITESGDNYVTES